MKERPILFSGPMVRALLANTKTQTRRLLNPQPVLDKMPNRMTGTEDRGWVVNDDGKTWRYDALRDGEQVAQCGPYPCPYGLPGERLWVKETFIDEHKNFPEAPKRFLYRADFSEQVLGPGWTPSIFCTRKASRITLEIVSVRVERLQQISESDAIAEGVERNVGSEPWTPEDGWLKYPLDAHTEDFPAFTAKDSYRTLWESINGADSWTENPWVWVVEFRRVSQ